MAVAARQAAEEFAKAKEAQTAKVDLDIRMVYAEAARLQSQASVEAAKKFNGQLPAGSQLLFGLDQQVPQSPKK